MSFNLCDKSVSLSSEFSLSSKFFFVIKVFLCQQRFLRSHETFSFVKKYFYNKILSQGMFPQLALK